MSSRKRRRRPGTGGSAAVSPETECGPRVLAVASGKGGVGKSFFAATLSWQLASRGLRIISVDADFAGPNLHTCLGVAPQASKGLTELLSGKAVDDLLSETKLPNLKLLAASGGSLAAAGDSSGKWRRALEVLRGADVDLIVLDLGAGAALGTVDLFLAADAGVVVTTPEPTAIENAYRLLRTTFYRFLAREAQVESARKLVTQALYSAAGEGGSRSPVALLQAIGRKNAGVMRDLSQALESLDLTIVANQARLEEDARLAEAMAGAARKIFALPCRIGGTIPYDEKVGLALRKKTAFAEFAPNAAALEQVRRIAEQLALRLCPDGRSARPQRSAAS